MKNELPPLLAAAKKDGAIIIPVILKPSSFEKIQSLAQFQTLNNPNNALSKLPEHKRDEILVKLADRIEEIMKTVHSK